MVRFSYVLRATLALMVASATNSIAQEIPGGSSAATSQAISTEPVPRLVRFSGSIKDVLGKPVTGMAGVTFALYKEQEGGSALWLETQSVHLDASGHYTVMLGASKAEGLPTDLFASGEARWLGVQPEGQAEQPRVLLLSVPYALKAADSETLGGKPASAYALAAPQKADATSPVQSEGNVTPAATPTVHGSGTKNFLPIWTGTSLVGNSSLFQSGASVGIGTTTPATTLDVNGSSTVRGNQSVTGNLSATGAVAGQTGSFVGNTGLFTSLLSVVQHGTGTAITGFASATTGVTFAISGSASSASGVGVSGEGGTGVLGIGYTSSGGTGVSGSGVYGVQGTSSVAAGVGGAFNNTASGESLSARINGAEVFGVYPGGTLVNGRGLIVGSNAASAVVGDPGCGPGYAGVGFGGSLSGCNNYSMIGNHTDTFINRPSGGAIHFRENNGEQVTMVPGGAVGIGITAPNAKLDVRGSAGNSGLGIAVDSNAWQARGAGGWVKAMAFVDPFAQGGIAITECYNSQVTGTAINTPPCGITVTHNDQGRNNLDFGFLVGDRFVQLQTRVTIPCFNHAINDNTCTTSPGITIDDANQITATQLVVDTFNSTNFDLRDVPFYIFIY